MIAKDPTPNSFQPALLSAELRQALQNPYPSVRLGAVQALKRLLHAPEQAVVLAALQALERMREDHSQSVSEAANRIWAAYQVTHDFPSQRNADMKVNTLPRIKREVLDQPYIPTTPTEILFPNVIVNPDLAGEMSSTEAITVENSISFVESKPKMIPQPSGWRFMVLWIGTILMGCGLIWLGGNLFHDYLLLGLVGAVINMLQWVVLKEYIHGPWWWILTNTIYLFFVGILANQEKDPSAMWALLVVYLAVDLSFGPLLVWRERK